MTMEAAKVLDEAFEVYTTIARLPDDSPLSASHTSPVYENAAKLVKSLLPFTYNYYQHGSQAQDQITELIWVEMVDRNEVLTIEEAQRFMDECNICGNPLRSYGHYTECVR